jgi:hypothetical protein
MRLGPYFRALAGDDYSRSPLGNPLAGITAPQAMSPIAFLPFWFRIPASPAARPV